jgi:hypothetical protein
VEGVGRRDPVGVLGGGELVRQRRALLGQPPVEGQVGLGHLAGGLPVDGSEEPVSDDQRGLLLSGRCEHALRAGSDLAGLGQPLPELLALAAESIGGIGEGEHDHHALPAGRELEQRHQESDRLLGERIAAGGGGHGPGRAQVAGDLVDQDQGRSVADELVEQPAAGGSLGLAVGVGDQPVAGGAAELVGQLAPERISGHVRVEQATGRVELGADDAGDPHGTGRRDQLRGHERGRCLAAPRRVVERDQVVGLAAAEGRLQADHGVGRGDAPSEPAERLAQERAQARGRVGVVEEDGWILVDRVGAAVEDVLEAGREQLLA